MHPEVVEIFAVVDSKADSIDGVSAALVVPSTAHDTTHKLAMNLLNVTDFMRLPPAWK